MASKQHIRKRLGETPLLQTGSPGTKSKTNRSWQAQRKNTIRNPHRDHLHALMEAKPTCFKARKEYRWAFSNTLH